MPIEAQSLPTQRKKRRLIQVLLVVLSVLMTCYFVVAYFWAPSLIRQQLQTQLNSQLGMQAALSELSFNPFTFNVTVQDLVLTDVNQLEWYKSQTTEINFDPFNLLWGEYNFSAIKLIKPELNIIIDEEGQITLPAWPELGSSENDESLNLIIEHIAFDQALVDLKLGTVHEDFSLKINKLELNLDRFTLGDRDNKFKALMATAQNETMALDGLYNHQKKTFKSDVELTDVQAANLNQILPNYLKINTTSGTFQALGKITWRVETKPEITLANIEIQNLTSSWQQEVITSGLTVSLKNTSVDIENQTIAVEEITSTDGQWQINWPFELPNNQSKDTAENTPSNDINQTNNWQFSAAQIEIENWPVQVSDSEVNGVMPFNLNSFRINNFNTQNQTIDLTGQINFNHPGHINLNGDVVLSPLIINTEMSMAALAIPPFNPWLLNTAGVQFSDGSLTTAQKLNFKAGYFTTIGQLEVNASQLLNKNQVILAQWDELSVAASELNSQNKTIKLDQITLDKATGILPDSQNYPPVQSKSNPEDGKVKFTDKADRSPWSIIIGVIKPSKNNS